MKKAKYKKYNNYIIDSISVVWNILFCTFCLCCLSNVRRWQGIQIPIFGATRR